MIRKKIILLCVVLLALIQVPAQAWPFSEQTWQTMKKNAKDEVSYVLYWAKLPWVYWQQRKAEKIDDKSKLHALLISGISSGVSKERNIVGLLNRNKSVINEKYGSGHPICTVAYNTQSLAILLACGAEVDKKDGPPFENSPLHIAQDFMCDDNKNCTALLMACGAQPETLNIYNQSSFDAARNWHHEEAIQFMQNPELAKKHVLENVLPNLQLSQKTKDKLKARILQGTKQGAMFEFLKFGAQQNLQESLQDQLAKQSLLVKASKQHDDFPLPASVANEVLSFVDKETFTKKEHAVQLQQVHEKATRCGHTELAQVTHDVLTQIRPG